MVGRHRRSLRFYANYFSHAKAASELANFISHAPVGNQAAPNEISSYTCLIVDCWHHYCDFQLEFSPGIETNRRSSSCPSLSKVAHYSTIVLIDSHVCPSSHARGYTKRERSSLSLRIWLLLNPRLTKILFYKRTASVSDPPGIFVCCT